MFNDGGGPYVEYKARVAKMAGELGHIDLDECKIHAPICWDGWKVEKVKFEDWAEAELKGGFEHEQQGPVTCHVVLVVG